MKSKKKKGIVISILLVFALLAVTANTFFQIGQQSAVKKQSRRFGATYMTMNNSVYEVIDNEIRSEVEAEGDKLITRDPALDVNKQIQQMRDFIRMRVGAIFLNPVDIYRLHAVLLEAKQAGIPVVIVDSEVSDQNLVSCSIVSDNYGAGVLCAKHLMQSMKAANILLLEHKSAQSAVDRIQGFENTLHGHAAYRIVGRGDCTGQLEKAMPVVEHMLQEEPAANVVMALNDPSALGSMAALKGHNLLQKFSVFGVDGSPEAKKMIQAGHMTATVAQFPSKIGKTAVQQMYRLIEGKTYRKRCVIPVQLITRENIGNFALDSWQ